MRKKAIDLPLMEEGEGNIVLFHPYISEKGRKAVYEKLGTRWIGQGPAVDEFEKMFEKKFAKDYSCLAVGAGTDALHLAYILAGLKKGDEVITPVFTCSATNIPLLYLGAKIVFADIQPHTLNMDPVHVKSLITEKTKAIVCVHYGGLPCDMDELQEIADKARIPIIEDAAHALGAKYKDRYIGSVSDFSMFSFQAIKHITTGDGGMLSIKDRSLLDKAKRVRWFGIDRKGKQTGTWENDIWEVGYKYQMTDISATLGMCALNEFDQILQHRKKLFAIYERGLSQVPGIKFVGGGFSDRDHAAWLCTIIAENRMNLQEKLRKEGIETNQVHYRNDRYTLFKESQGYFPAMDSIEDNYLIIPVHHKVTFDAAERIVQLIKEGW